MRKWLWLTIPALLFLLAWILVPKAIAKYKYTVARNVVDTWLAPVQHAIVQNYPLSYERGWIAWLLAMIAQESSGKAEAINPRDPAYGLLQITPPVLSDFNRLNRKSYTVDDLLIPYKNLEVGLWYFQFLWKGNERDYEQTVMAYNAGQGNLEAGRPHLEHVKEYLSLIEPQLS